MIKKHFNRLGVSTGASEDEIKKAYRRQAMLFHPDKNNHPSAEEKFIKLNLSYEILMDYKAGGNLTYSIKTNSRKHTHHKTDKRTTYYNNTKFTIAWNLQQKKERQEYEYYTKLKWYHPTKLYDFFDNYGIAITLTILSITLVIFGIGLILFGLKNNKKGEGLVFAGIFLIIMCIGLSFAVIKTLRQTL